MRKYDIYKNSGIEWIEELPTNWNVKKIKHRCYVKARVGWKGLKSDEFLTDGYSYLVTGSDFKNDSVNWNECYHIDEARYEEDPYIQLKVDDLLITKDGTIGKLAIVKELDKPACLNSGIFVVRSTNEDFKTEFLFWVLKSKAFKQFNDYTSYGSTIQHLYQNIFVEFAFPFPKTEEQIAIANYLDRKTDEIDELIDDKKRLLELYEEEKTAIINEAVTKGINPVARMKDSGTEWLGEIPEHWEVKRIDRITNIVRGNTGFRKDELLDFGEYVALQYGKTYKVNEVNDSFCFYVNSEFYKLNQIVQFGDVILISTSETLEDLGHSCFYARNDLGLLGGEQILLRTMNSSVFGKYLFYSSKVFCVLLRKFARGIKVFRFNIDNLKEIYFPFPPIEEQQSIVRYIETECALIDAKKEKTEKLIELLNEYRTALISEVVTGKVKVME